MKKILPILLLSFIYIACVDPNSLKSIEPLHPSDMTVSAFLNAVKIPGGKTHKINVVSISDEFPENWLKTADIDTLVALVKSKEKCYCIINPLSSYIPSDSADIGGYTIELIRAFQQKTKVTFGLYSCPKLILTKPLR